MIDDLTSQAIAAALRHDWEAAITLNQKVLQENDRDCDALNRLAYAFSEVHRYDEAEEIFQRVLVLDPRNLIATKNLLKISKLKGTPVTDTNSNHEEINTHTLVDPHLFLEESGKTKTCHLIRIAAKDVLANLRIGNKVVLLSKSRSIAVLTQQETCIGYLPDDLSFTLYRLMQGGNHYEAFIRSVATNLITIFIRETKKSSRFKDIPSFMDTKRLHHKHAVLREPLAEELTDQFPPTDGAESEREFYEAE